MMLRFILCALALIVMPVLSSVTKGSKGGMKSTKSTKGKGGGGYKPAPLPTLKPVPLPTRKPVPLPTVSTPRPTPLPTPLPKCSFAGPKQAASFGNIALAKFWDDVLKTNCSKTEISLVYDDYFDPDVVVTNDGNATAITNLTALKASPFFTTVVDSCNSTGTYYSWVTFNATISKNESDVVTLTTNRIISNDTGLCGYGYSYTAKVSGPKCDDVKVTVIAADGNLTLPGLTKCQ